MNRPVDTSSAEQRRVRRVDDGVDTKLCDVAPEGMDTVFIIDPDDRFCRLRLAGAALQSPKPQVELAPDEL